MSANHDSRQGFKFLFENLYHLYKKEGSQEGAQGGAHDGVREFVAPEIIPVGKPLGESGPRNGQVLKFQEASVAEVKPYTPMEILKFPKAEAPAMPVETAADPAFASLKSDLSELQDLQSRLHFMLQELEELTRDPRSDDEE